VILSKCVVYFNSTNTTIVSWRNCFVSEQPRI